MRRRARARLGAIAAVSKCGAATFSHRSPSLFGVVGNHAAATAAATADNDDDNDDDDDDDNDDDGNGGGAFETIARSVARITATSSAALIAAAFCCQQSRARTSRLAAARLREFFCLFERSGGGEFCARVNARKSD